MSVTTVEPDLDNLTLTVVADFEASVEEVWELWANSEKLGRWWGPPEYLTTFEPYDLSAGRLSATLTCASRRKRN